MIIFLPQKPAEVFAKKKNFVLEASQENLLAFLTEETDDKEMTTVQVESSETRETEDDHKLLPAPTPQHRFEEIKSRRLSAPGREPRFLRLVKSRGGQESKEQNIKNRISLDLEEETESDKNQNNSTKSRDLFDQVRYLRTSRF